jgi:hypothetical protein
MGINTPERVFGKAEEFGMDFQGERTADLALALGGPRRSDPVDLVTAYGPRSANGGKAIGHTSILAIKDVSRQGRRRSVPCRPPANR